MPLQVTIWSIRSDSMKDQREVSVIEVYIVWSKASLNFIRQEVRLFGMKVVDGLHPDTEL